MDVAENYRAEAVHLLWNLKMIIEKEAAGRMSVIHFNKLLYNPQYRYATFVDAHKLGNHKISLIIKHLMAIPDIEKIVLRKAPPAPGENKIFTTTTKQAKVPVKPEPVHYKNTTKTPITKHTAVIPKKTEHSKIVALRAQKKHISREIDTRPNSITTQQEIITTFGSKQNPPNRNIFVIGAASLLLAIIVIVLFTIFSINSYEHVSGSILQTTNWYADTTYILKDKVFVEANATLIIEPGTRILGTKNSALIITRDATIYARGTAEKPIIFTSSEAVGKRKPGDWGGLVMLGNARLNKIDAYIEGIPQADVRGYYGGQQMNANCGILQYVRVEYAGHIVSANKELNGITLGGCGQETIISHVQVHRALDDGMAIFGGNVDLKYIYITGAGDDSIDWDLGWQGRAQFITIHQYKDIGNNAIEGDNRKGKPLAVPISKPQFFNMTMIASSGNFSKHRAITLRNGSGGLFQNVIIAGHNIESIDLRGADVDILTENELIQLDHSIIFNIGRNGLRYFLPEIDQSNDDAGFNEAAYFNREIFNNHFGQDPRIPIAAFRQRKADYVPEKTSLLQQNPAAIPQQEFWDESANYIGAFRPGISRSWLTGWITSDEN